MASRRSRRSGRQRTLLPLRSGQLPPNSLSCWYCDWKIRAFNDTLFFIGQRHARFLRMWFTMGAAFGLVALIGVTVLLIWELTGAFHHYNVTSGLKSVSLRWLFGTLPLGRSSGLSTWIMNAGVMFFSTSFSVAIHEFGHAIAAASEDVQIEYIAIFLAIIFPGALVSFNYDLLQSLPRLAALRIYCAGIWHNVMFCAVCCITLFLLPLILSPLYVHGETLMVLGVPRTSPLAGYLSYGDLITAVDSSKIHYPSEWTEKIIQINSQRFHKEVGGIKGYCVPNSWLIGANNTRAINDFLCPEDTTTFESVPCLNYSMFTGINGQNSDGNRRKTKQCLSAKDVVKLDKCGGGWETTRTDIFNCACLENESCMTPAQVPGVSWVEISYSSPYSPECIHLRKNTLNSSYISDDISTACAGTFVFVGDVLSLAYSIHLSPYQPRWAYLGANVPSSLESILSCTFHISATLVVLNILPVYFLDGESILETSLCYITWLSARRRHKILRLCLIGGGIGSIIAFTKLLYTIVVFHNYLSLDSY